MQDALIQHLTHQGQSYDCKQVPTSSDIYDNAGEWLWCWGSGPPGETLLILASIVDLRWWYSIFQISIPNPRKTRLAFIFFCLLWSPADTRAPDITVSAKNKTKKNINTWAAVLLAIQRLKEILKLPMGMQVA